jgi:hypothetical protein
LVAGHQRVQIVPGVHKYSLHGARKLRFRFDSQVFRLPVCRGVTFRRPAANTHPVNCTFFLKCSQTRELLQLQDYTTFRITLTGTVQTIYKVSMRRLR